jgi:16S rRNA processing protein RimM
MWPEPKRWKKSPSKVRDRNCSPSSGSGMARRSKGAERADGADLLLVGRIGPAHGVKGEVKVVPETDDPARFANLDTVFVGEEAETAVPAQVESVRFQEGQHGTTPLVKLESISSREEAEEKRGLLVFARQEDLPPLEPGEFFLHSLQGMNVEGEDGERIGAVRDVIELPGHPILVIGRSGAPDAMIPAVPEFVVDVDLDAGRIVVRIIEGLLE